MFIKVYVLNYIIIIYYFFKFDFYLRKKALETE